MANGTAVAVECLKRAGIHEWQPGQPMLVEVGCPLIHLLLSGSA
jgi:hypothetical protein